MPDFSGILQEAANRYGIPVGVLQRQMMAESGGNPNAKSPVGAMGLMQLMPATARGLGVTNPNDPRQNIMAGAHYLRDQINHFGSLKLALAAYNAGPAAVARYGGIPPYAETHDYVQKILGGLPGVGAAPQESPPVLAASAGRLGDSAPTTLPKMPNFMAMANQFADQAAGDTGAQAGGDIVMPSNVDMNTWKQFLPGGAKPRTDPARGEANAAIANEIGPLRAYSSRFAPQLEGAPHSGIVQAAKGYLGIPYKWGGTSRQTGMDCSGFLQNVMKDVGIKIGRTTYEQVKEGQPVQLKNLQPGDAVFTEPGHAGPNHVGLYVGHGMIQESPHTGTVNSYIPLRDYLGGGFVAARRYAQMAPQPKKK